MKIIYALLFGIAIAVIGVIAYMAMVRFDAAMQRIDREQDLQAIQDCAIAYRQERTDTDTGITTIRPLEQQLRECAWLKGVQWDGVWSDIPATSTP
jgi:type II secretory pathway pseudopilin PulG